MTVPRITVILCLAVGVGTIAYAQSSAARNIGGAWVPMGGGRGADPKVAPPPATAIVLKPTYAAAQEARRAADAERTRRGEPPPSPAVLCLPYGMPRMMTVASYPIEILQTPGQITIVTEAFSEVRRVYLDQPQLPIDEVPPGYYGRSVGKWDGDTLVVDTVGVKESVPSYNGLVHSDRMRITERIRLVTPDVLHLVVGEQAARLYPAEGHQPGHATTERVTADLADAMRRLLIPPQAGTTPASGGCALGGRVVR